MERIVDDLMRDEGVRLKPYRCTAGKLTIGVGRNLEDVGISDMEARILLENDLRGVESDLDRNVPWWRDLSDTRRRAIMNMCFNLGWPRLAGFQRMWAALEQRKFDAAAREALDSKWARDVGARADRVAKLIKEG